PLRPVAPRAVTPRPTSPRSVAARSLAASPSAASLLVASLLVACSGDGRAGDSTTPPPAEDGPYTVGEEVAPEDLPTEEEAAPLRPEDALGFASMHPSLEDDGCLAPDELDAEAEAWRVGPGAHLVWQPCHQGAYQVRGALFLVHDSGEVERLALPYAAPDGAILTEAATGTWRFDPGTREGVDTVRFRGVGDCGRQLRYRVDESGGLTLLEHREEPCDDTPPEAIGPAGWTVRYPPPSD
ncbi:MAG: hypothetical protein CMH59_17230, partial [Myxococcales bacterium]|nr:hypothetical protein [Myxococcales bacterium]